MQQIIARDRSGRMCIDINSNQSRCTVVGESHHRRRSRLIIPRSRCSLGRTRFNDPAVLRPKKTNYFVFPREIINIYIYVYTDRNLLPRSDAYELSFTKNLSEHSLRCHHLPYRRARTTPSHYDPAA